jgi:hypothetical protein
MQGLVADFYEVPRDRLGELRDAASGNWRRLGRNRQHWNSTLGGLRRPVPRYESPDYYLAAVLWVVGDTPLKGGGEMLGDCTPEYQDLLMELVEGHGGGWEIIEPSAERIAALDPAGFDPERLRAHYSGESEYYPDEEDADDEPGLLGRLLDRLISAAPERHPADAGEEMLRHIALLRSALTNVRDGNVLLIHLH